jgi:hypothetical protein
MNVRHRDQKLFEAQAKETCGSVGTTRIPLVWKREISRERTTGAHNAGLSVDETLRVNNNASKTYSDGKFCTVKMLSLCKEVSNWDDPPAFTTY